MATASGISVTGMAWTTAVGDGLESVWARLLAGESGLRGVPHERRLRNSLAAPVPWAADATPEQRLVGMASGCVRRAMEVAGLDLADPEVQLVLGTSLAAYLEDGTSRDRLSGWASAVAGEVGALRPPVSVSTACSASSDAILVGAELIRAGVARRCVCGGVDVLTWSKRIAHSTLGTMSPTALRAFDVRHDGTLLGEGAAFVVLEAPGRGQAPLAFLRGTGSANDASGMTAADVTGRSARYAMERSLLDAGLQASDVGLINAHGSGTPMNDTTECNAYRETFTGPMRPLVFATKGNFGHTLGATGAIEAIALIMAMRTGQVPPIAGLEQPDPECALPLASLAPSGCDARFGLSITLGFGGFDTSLVFEAA